MKPTKLHAVVAGVLEIEPEELNSDSDLTDFELFDSVGVLTLMIELDQQMGIKMES